MTEASPQHLIKEQLVDLLPYEIVWITEDGKIDYCNAAACVNTGYTKKQALKMTVFELFPDVNCETWSNYWQLLKSTTTQLLKMNYQAKNGSLHEIEVQAQYFSNNRTDVISFLMNEISNSSFYREVLNRAEKIVQAGGWKLNLKDNSLIVTTESFKIFEVCDKEEFRPVNIRKYIRQAERFETGIAEAIRLGKPFDHVFEIVTAKGNTKFIRCMVEPTLEARKVNRLIGVYQDITAEYRKSESLQLFKDIIDHSDDIVFIYEENGDLLHYSDSAISQLQFTNYDLDSATIYVLDSQVDEKWWKSHFEEIKKRKHFRMEWIATRKDGTRFPVDISVNHIQHQGRNLNCAVLRDITNRKNRELQLQNALTELKTLKNQLEGENEYLQEEIHNKINFGDIISDSEEYQEVLRLVEQVAPTKTSVLITGESGTGKELLANAIHQHSDRKDRPMIKVNCATLPKELIESELFGHRKGAFTGALKDKLGKFALANEGTIFLDEIGELPLELQAKLLRVLQEGEYDVLGDVKTHKTDVRIIFATNRDLEKMVSEGSFREDLYYRINVFPIHNLPLRDRVEDIPVLATYFLNKYAAQAGKHFTGIAKKTIDTLRRYSFPGNIRELENLIERAVIVENGPTLNPGTWLPDVKKAPKQDNFKTFEEIQREYILEVLSKTRGKVSGQGGAASLLDMNAKTLFAKMKKLGINKTLKHEVSN